MSPVDTRWLAQVNPTPIDRDRDCDGCGYNLIGLRTSDRCPECGRQISLSAWEDEDSRWGRTPMVLIAAGPLRDAPIGYQRRLLLGCRLLLFGALAGCGAWLVALLIQPFAALTTPWWAFIWLAGVAMVTAPRQVPSRRDGKKPDTHAEWIGVRRAAFWTQTLWVLTALAGVAWALRRDVSGLQIVLAMSGFLASGGVVAVLLQLSHLAAWAGDIGLAFRMRALTIPFVIGLCVGAVWIATGADLPSFQSHLEPLSFLYAAWRSLVVALTFGPWVYAIWCLVQMESLVRRSRNRTRTF